MDRHLPALLIEVNAPERWLDTLQALGYTTCRFDAGPARLTPVRDLAGILNLLCLHPQSTGRVSETLSRFLDGRAQIRSTA